MAVLTDIGDSTSIATAQQAALDWVKSNDRSMRSDGGIWLEFHGDQQAITTYQSLALRWLQSRDKELRWEELESLIRIGKKLSLDQSAIDLLRQLADDSDENVAGEARMVLGDAGVSRQ